MYCVSRYVSYFGVRRDVVEVPVERLVGHPILDHAGLAFDDIARVE